MPGGLSSASAVLLYAAQGVNPLPRCFSATGLEAAMGSTTTKGDTIRLTSIDPLEVPPSTWNNVRTRTNTVPGSKRSVSTSGGLSESGTGERAGKLAKLSEMLAKVAKDYTERLRSTERWRWWRVCRKKVSAAIVDLAACELGYRAFRETESGLEHLAKECLADGSETERSETASKKSLKFSEWLLYYWYTVAGAWPSTCTLALLSAKELVNAPCSYQPTAYEQQKAFEAVRRFLKRVRDRPLTVENVKVEDILCCIKFCVDLSGCYGIIVEYGYNPDGTPESQRVKQADVRRVVKDCGEVLKALVLDWESLIADLPKVERHDPDYIEAARVATDEAIDNVLGTGDPCAVTRCIARRYWGTRTDWGVKEEARAFHKEFYPWLVLYPALYPEKRPKTPADWTVDLLRQQFDSLLSTLGSAIHPRYLAIYPGAQSWLPKLEELYRDNSFMLADLALECLECLEDLLKDKDCFKKQKAELKSLRKEIQSACTTSILSTNPTTSGLASAEQEADSKLLSKTEGDQEDARRVTMRYLGWKTLCSERPETTPAAYKDEEQLRPLRGRLASISASVAEKVKKFSAGDASWSPPVKRPKRVDRDSRLGIVGGEGEEVLCQRCKLEVACERVARDSRLGVVGGEPVQRKCSL